MLAILFVDITHGNLDVREAASEQFTRLVESWENGHKPHPEGWVLIQTCYRTELFVEGSHTDIENTLTILRELFPSSLGQVLNPREIFSRLALMTAGVLSPTLGEPQIAHQVKSAYENAKGHITSTLHRLFTSAFQCAKQIRTETRIQEGHLSIPSSVVDQIKSAFPDKIPKIFILGTGEIALATALSLVKKGYREIALASRTLKRASQAVAQLRCGEPLEWNFNHVPSYLNKYDILISATAAPYFMWTHGMVSRHLKPHSERWFFDLAVPRDVEPSIANIPGIHLVTVDDINRHVQFTREMKEHVITQAREIARRSGQRFENWLHEQTLNQAFALLVQEAETMRTEMLHACLNGSPYINMKREEFDEFTRHLTQKLLHSTFRTLRSLRLPNS